MFGRRPDATLVKNLSTMRAFMPFISPRRAESVFYYTNEIEADAAIAFVDEYNRNAAEERKLTLFHLVLRATAFAIRDYSEVNRFVCGGRIWQRNHVALTFSAKRELVRGSPLVTVKRVFEPEETLEDVIGAVVSRTHKRRSGEKTQSDREMHFALRFPTPLIRAGVWLLHQANQFGMLPKSMIDDDPLFCSCFVANLGSVNMNAGYHHVWEYGTCSMFSVMGVLKDHPSGRKVFDLAYTYDERMADGHVGGVGMAYIKDLLENPTKLV